jgi:hypothetical protein
MTLGVQIVAGWMAFVALFALGTLAWAIYAGQLDDADYIKYIPFNEKEPEDWPGRQTAAKGV